MKSSIFVLGIVASALIAASATAISKMTSATPTAVISVPLDDGVKGGGFSMPAPEKITSRQAILLSMAYDIAKHDGHKYPQILQGIILLESKAGTMRAYKVAGHEFGLKVNERYYGVAQLKLSAARDVIRAFPSIKKEFKFQTDTDEEIIAKLIENDRFNLSVASKYLLILKRYGFDTVQELALAYNQGPGGAKNHDEATHSYVLGVMKHIQSLPRKSDKQKNS